MDKIVLKEYYNTIFIPYYGKNFCFILEKNFTESGKLDCLFTFYEGTNEKKVKIGEANVLLEWVFESTLVSIKIITGFRGRHYSILIMRVVAEFIKNNGIEKFDLTDDSDNVYNEKKNLYKKVGCGDLYMYTEEYEKNEEAREEVEGINYTPLDRETKHIRVCKVDDVVSETNEIFKIDKESIVDFNNVSLQN